MKKHQTNTTLTLCERGAATCPHFVVGMSLSDTERELDDNVDDTRSSVDYGEEKKPIKSSDNGCEIKTHSSFGVGVVGGLVYCRNELKEGGN